MEGTQGIIPETDLWPTHTHTHTHTHTEITRSYTHRQTPKSKIAVGTAHW
jgi:hypothetical protein